MDADTRNIAYILAVAHGGDSAYEAMHSLYISVRLAKGRALGHVANRSV